MAHPIMSGIRLNNLRKAYGPTAYIGNSIFTDFSLFSYLSRPVRPVNRPNVRLVAVTTYGSLGRVPRGSPPGEQKKLGNGHFWDMRNVAKCPFSAVLKNMQKWHFFYYVFTRGVYKTDHFWDLSRNPKLGNQVFGSQ